MRRIVFLSLAIILTFTPAYAQTILEQVEEGRERGPSEKARTPTAIEHVRPNPERGLFPEAPATESGPPDVVSSRSETHFTVRGFGNNEANLPHPLTIGGWSVTLADIQSSDHYSFWLKDRRSSNSPLVLFCKNSACTSTGHPTRIQLSLARPLDSLYIAPIASSETGTWAVRFVKNGPCTPTTDVLQFDGDYSIRMCYVTGEGETGQAQAGVWASSQSGILWFFSRENAEVLVKVLDGCKRNGYRWVFVAPVTDVGFELRVTGPDGETWTHTNAVGTTASTISDTNAFRCR